LIEDDDDEESKLNESFVLESFVASSDFMLFSDAFEFINELIWALFT